MDIRTRFRTLVDFSTESIFFEDSVTGVEFFIDTLGVQNENPELEEEAKVDLVQYFLSYYLDMIGFDARPLARLLRHNSLANIFGIVNKVYLPRAQATGTDVESGLRQAYEVMGIAVSLLEKRERARKQIKEYKGLA